MAEEYTKQKTERGSSDHIPQGQYLLPKINEQKHLLHNSAGHSLEAAAQFSTVLAVKTGGYIIGSLQKENHTITYNLLITPYFIFQLLCNIRINEKRS